LEKQTEEKEHIRGFIKLNKDPKIENITAKNVILRESVLRLTDWLIGLVVFVGEETFIAKKKKNTFQKFSYEEEFLNQIMFVFIIFIIVITMVFIFFIF